ncbi:MAG: hypothetical protein H6987_19060 [Pseudomonadales bacterium]|nr:hypothetical protein [Pseudomonadales bacterium]
MSVLTTYLTALAGMLVISGGWLAVQRLWQRHFPEHGAAGQDEDALAGRSGCHACNCAPTQCERESGRASTCSSSPNPSQQATEAS